MRNQESNAYQRIEVKESKGGFTDPGWIEYKGERHHLTAIGLSGRVKGFQQKVLGRWLGMPGLNVKANCIKVFLPSIQSCPL